MPFKIYADETTSLGANASDTLEFEIPPGMPFQVHKLYIKSTGTFKIKEIRDAEENHYLSGTIYSDQITDTAGKVMKIAEVEPFVIANRLYMEVQDTSGSTNNIYIAVVGIQATK